MNLPLQQPHTITAQSVQDHNRSGRAYGPFVRADTAKLVAQGKGEWGGNGSVSSSEYVVWRDAQDVLWGLQVMGGPVRLSESEPEDAAVETILGKLEAGERAVLEARLARR